MNKKKVQKLLTALQDTGKPDVDGLIRQMEYIVREQIAIDEFRKIAKDYFTEEETEELIDGYNNRKSSCY